MKRLLTSTALIAALAVPAMAQDYTPDPEARTGGAITITYKDDVATLDPAIGYDWQNWSMIKSVFDGLMDYVPGTTELRPGLAESYEISDDGLTYTFKLRSGVTFHNGREMTAEDMKYSLDRVTDPETQSPGAGFFGAIEGFDAASSGEAEGLSGVKVVDDSTVEITLTRPDATFLHVMALNFASVVPQEAVEAAGLTFIGPSAKAIRAMGLKDAAKKLMEEAQGAAQKIAEKSMLATVAAKEAVNRAEEVSLSEGLLFEKRLFQSLFASEDQKEGMAAFQEKREAQFRDK